MAVTLEGKKPTESAIALFGFAVTEARAARVGFWNNPEASPANLHNLASSIVSLARGLNDMAIGLRATYLKLEQMEAKIDALAKAPRSPR